MASILEQQIRATEMALFSGQPPRVKMATAQEQVHIAARRLKHLVELTAAATKKLDAAQAAQTQAEEELRRAEAYRASFEVEVAAADLALGANSTGDYGGYGDASCWNAGGFLCYL